MKATKTTPSYTIPANTIYGTPTTLSSVDRNGNVKPSKVTVTVTTAGKSKKVYVVNIAVVAEMPAPKSMAAAPAAPSSGVKTLAAGSAGEPPVCDANLQ